MLFLVGLLPFYYILNLGLEVYYPNYLGVMDFVLYVYAGTCLMGCLGVYESYILALRKGRVLTSFYAMALAVITLFCFIVESQDFGLIGYAIVFCIGRLLCLAIVVFLSHSLSRRLAGPPVTIVG